jgi:hypothetical protein
LAKIGRRIVIKLARGRLKFFLVFNGMPQKANRFIQLGVSKSAKGKSSSHISHRIHLEKLRALVLIITGSKTAFHRMLFQKTRQNMGSTPRCKASPSFGNRWQFRKTAINCWRRNSAGEERIARTPLGFCAVKQVIAAQPLHPQRGKGFKISLLHPHLHTIVPANGKSNWQ